MKLKICIDCNERASAIASKHRLCIQCRKARTKANKLKWKAKQAPIDRDMTAAQIEAKLRALDLERKAKRWAVSA